MPSRSLTTTLLALLCVSAALAQPNSAERVRAFAALPNWTGIWQSAAWPLEVSGRLPGGEAQLRELLQLIRRPPYNSEWAARYEAALGDVAAEARLRASFKACTRSFPALMEAPWMFEVAVLPEETLLIFENGQVRHIYTDGRRHPSGADLWPTYLGDSVGRWQGDTLIVDTVARTSTEPLAPRAWFAMLSDRAHFTERLRLVGSDLEDQLTIEDPIALAAPWQITLRFKRLTEMSRMLPYDCTENDRNPVVDGKLTITNP
jgi:hypothetical protein